MVIKILVVVLGGAVVVYGLACLITRLSFRKYELTLDEMRGVIQRCEEDYRDRVGGRPNGR